MSILKIKDSQGNWVGVPTIKGDKGNGIQSAVLNNDYTLTLTFTDGTTYTTPSIRGEKGEQGEPATDMDIHICSASEYDAETRIPTIANPNDKTFYLVPTEDGTSPDLFTEWVYVNNAWEMFGSASVDLSGYLTDVQIDGQSIVSDGVANVPLADYNVLGVTKLDSSRGIFNNNGFATIYPSQPNDIKLGNGNRRPITPMYQHTSVFYGLAKASGDATQSQSSNAVGTYTDEAKASIKNMLGVQDNMRVDIIKEEDSETWQSSRTFTEIYNAIIKGINVIVDDNDLLLPYVGQLYQNNIYWLAFGISTIFNNTNILFGYLIGDNNGQTVVTQINQNTPIPQIDDSTTSGSSVWSSSKIKDELDNKVGDVQINGNSIVTDGVAEIPIASPTTLGVLKPDNASLGIKTDSAGQLIIKDRPLVYYKSANRNTAVVCSSQHISTFYGLTKAAGVDMSTSSNAVGTYTDEAKTAIKQMLGVHDTIDSFVEEVTGTDVTITGQPSYRYNCGEVLSLTVTPPETGTIDIRFTSGSSPTVLTLPSTVKMPEWWVEVEANTIYEMCITDGVYCGVMSWAM